MRRNVGVVTSPTAIELSLAMRPAPSRLSWSALARHRRALSTLRPPALTALIRRQTTADELMSVHKQHQTDFNHIHISQTWKQLAFFAQRSPPAELQRRATLLEPLAPTIAVRVPSHQGD